MSSNDVQPDEPTQTTNNNINNQDVTKESSTTTSAENDKSPLPKVENAHEFHQSATSDINKTEDLSIPAIESTTDVNKHDPEISTQESTKSSSSQVQPTTAIETSKTDANKHTPTTSTHEPESSSPTDVKPTDRTETSKTQIPDLDTNTQSTSVSTEDHVNSLPTKSQPVVAPEPSTSQIPDSNINKQSNIVSTEDHGNSLPNKPQPTVTTEPSTFEVSNPDVNKQATTVSTEDHGNSLPTETKQKTTSESSISPDSNDNKQDTAISSHDSTTKDATSKQESGLVDQTSCTIPDNEAKKDTSWTDQLTKLFTPKKKAKKTKKTSDDSKTEYDKSTNDSTLVQDRPHLINLIREELDFLRDICPKLEKDQDRITKEVERASEEHAKLLREERCELKELKDLKESVTKLMLQIPEKYRTNDDKDQQKNQTNFTKSDNEAKKDTSWTDQLTKLFSPKEKGKKLQKPSDDLETDYDKSTNESIPDQDRPHLINLIREELDFVREICPKLGKHQVHITNEARKAYEEHEKLLQEDRCDLKELKDLKRNVTKLKLQIPAKYRTYDDKDQQKNQKLFLDNRGLTSAKLLKNLPRLHNKLFHESLFCKTMQQRYNDLSLELKLCLLCFSVFPENTEISRRIIVYWWIAEGLILGEDDHEKTVEDRANELFAELMNKDFIEPASRSLPDRRVATCKMQTMIRAALVMISDKVKFFDFDKFGDPKDFGKFDEIESPEEMPVIYPLGDPREFFDFFDEKRERIPSEETIEFTDEKGNPIPFANYIPNKDRVDDKVLDRNEIPIDTNRKHYYYVKKNITMKSYKACLMGTGLSKHLNWEKLHMLFNVKDDILEFKPEWFLRMKNVNILFLGRWQSSAAHHIEVEEFKFKESLEHLKHVRFFSLQGVSRVSELPQSISSLESLLILDLRACHNLEKIPKTIGSLKCLTHLDMSECYLLKHIPTEISSLESLQVLKGFVVVDSQEKHVCTLKDLAKLENLRKLSMYTHMKDFPEKSHLEALQKLEALRKLTILWGGQESKSQKNQTKQDKTKQDNAGNKKSMYPSILSTMYPKEKRVQGSVRRMNAFNTSTLGSRLEKLDLKCFPEKGTPNWLKPGSLPGLKKLYIRGGQFSDLGQYQDIYECDDSLNIPKLETWNVKVLRLKYLDELKMEWKELQNLFPEMTYLEKVKCPMLSMFPCDEHGVWIQKPSTSG